MQDFLWWRDGVIYQIYPRSFSDSNGDGLGDLPGIISKLDYLADLGIDAIWLSPIYPSPDKDFGYDVSDYCTIDPRFGNLQDFDQLVSLAHERGIRIILDMVMNHTSTQHPWFKESRSERSNPKRDWYIWRDPNPISGKTGRRRKHFPNNWQASFGGSAWEYDRTTGQYYLHLFTKDQPDLNWRNPLVRQAQLEAFRFWMERGVDGFRLDVFNAFFKDAGLRDNPVKFGLRGFDRQRHIYDIDQPEMLPLVNDLRRILDSFPERYAVGETFLASPEKSILYCGPDKLHAAFSFDLISNDLIYPWNPHWIIQQIIQREQTFKPAGIWPTTVLSNHDLPRAASRYSHSEKDDQAKIAMALLLTLRGTPYMYYGEEIGMRNIQLRRIEILDPPGRRYWPFYKGRDGCRAPMQWDSGTQAGFTTGIPWLPVHPDSHLRNVASQQSDPHSLFHFTKSLLALRKAHPALRKGEFTALKSPGGMLAYLRETPEQTIMVVINFKRSIRKFRVPAGVWQVLFSSRQNASDPQAALAPCEVRILLGKKPI